MIECKDPWNVMDLEYADEFIEMIRYSLPEDHPLTNRDFFPEAMIPKTSVFLIKDDTTGNSVILDLRKRMKHRGKRMPYYKEFRNKSDIQARIAKDHDEWLASLPNDDER